VTAAVGGSLQRAWAEFEEFCNELYSHDELEGQSERRMIREYKAIYLEAGGGS
jgi:hypothetical protein